MEKVDIIELVKYRNYLHKELKKELRQLEIAEQDLLKTPNRQIRLQRMKDIKRKLAEVDKTFRETATFKTEEFVDFMTKFLVLTEGDYVKTRFKPVTISGQEKPVEYYMISHPETRESLKEIIKNQYDLERFLFSKSPEDVTKFKGPYTYPFKKNTKMKNQYKKHYRLKIAIYELMQLKIDNPDITDEERYNIVLENTIKRNYVIGNKKESNK